MEKDIIIRLHKDFEQSLYKQQGTDMEFWLARDLQSLLGYARWENFAKVIEKAKTACKTAGFEVADHFLDITKKVSLGSGAQRHESTYAPAHHLSEYGINNLNSVSSLHTIMYNLAEISDNFDSDDRDGETTAVDRSDGFNDTEGAIIANACYRGAIRSAGAVLRLFYYTIGPSTNMYTPSGLCSGINGVSLEADATSYGDDASHNYDQINHVTFSYTLNDNGSGYYTTAAMMDVEKVISRNCIALQYNI